MMQNVLNVMVDRKHAIEPLLDNFAEEGNLTLLFFLPRPKKSETLTPIGSSRRYAFVQGRASSTKFYQGFRHLYIKSGMHHG